jgi:hypothetical protein
LQELASVTRLQPDRPSPPHSHLNHEQLSFTF